MAKMKIKYATGEYYWTDTYGKVKVLGCKANNKIRIMQEDGTILDLTCITTSGENIDVSKVEIVNDEDDSGSSSDDSSADDSGFSPDVSTDPDPDTLDPNS